LQAAFNPRYGWISVNVNPWLAFPSFLIQPCLQLPKISSFFDAMPSFVLNDHTNAGVQNIADPIGDKVFGLCPVLFDVL
jgi:hypothetical protein